MDYFGLDAVTDLFWIVGIMWGLIFVGTLLFLSTIPDEDDDAEQVEYLNHLYRISPGEDDDR